MERRGASAPYGETQDARRASQARQLSASRRSIPSASCWGTTTPGPLLPGATPPGRVAGDNSPGTRPGHEGRPRASRGGTRARRPRAANNRGDDARLLDTHSAVIVRASGRSSNHDGVGVYWVPAFAGTTRSDASPRACPRLDRRMQAATEAAWFETRGLRRAPHHEGKCRRGNERNLERAQWKAFQ